MQRGALNRSEWMGFLRGLAVTGIVSHHWLLFISFDRNPSAISAVAKFLFEVSGTGVQLFFILSGCGLAVSYLRRNERFLLGEWAGGRFRKIVLPYWIMVVGTFVLANAASLGMGNDAATQLWKYGDRYNDALTGAGLFLMTISLWSFVRRKTGGKLDSVASEVSRVSYMMYLIRVPLILYVLKPLLGRTTSLPLNPLLALVSSGFFIFVVFLLARFLYGPVMSLSLGQTWFTAEARRA